MQDQKQKRQPRLPSGFAPDKSGRRALAVFLTEALDAACGIDNFLLARVKRMASGTDFNMQRFTAGRSRLERVAATTRHFDLGVLRVDAFFHGLILCVLRRRDFCAGKGRIIPKNRPQSNRRGC
jgi:hypothetical protein